MALIGAKIDSVISIVYVFTRPNADGTFTEQDTLNATDAKKTIISVFPLLCMVIRTGTN